MTAFPTQPLSNQPGSAAEFPSFSPPSMPGLPGTPERAEHVDKMVAAHRAATPAHITAQRQNTRNSIDELNQSDPEELRDRFLHQPYDTRSPVQQVLDMVDLPRNAIANLIFRDTARSQAEKGETGAFGLPTVHVSDALREMGVHNRVALAIGGFVGDVALDPLTYLGPAGWGTQVGKVGLRNVGVKSIKGAIEEASVGGLKAVTDDTARGVLKAAGVGEQAMDKSAISKAVFGDYSKGKVERAFRVLGGERTTSGGVFDKFADAAKTAENPLEHESIDAVKDFVAQYGRGTEPGVKIGNGGSAVAHLPFGGTLGIPDFTVQVPGFTPAGKAAVTTLQIAKDKQLGEVPKGLESIHDDLNLARQQADIERDFSKQRVDAIDDMRERVESGPHDPALQESLRVAEEDHATQMQEAAEHADAAAQSIRQKVSDFVDSGTATKANPNSILAARDKWKEAKLLADKMRVDADTWDNARKARSAINGDISSGVEKTTDTLNRILAQQQGSGRGPNGVAYTEGLPINVGDTVDRIRGGSLGDDGALVQRVVRDKDANLHAIVGPNPEDKIPFSDLHVLENRPRSEVGNLSVSADDTRRLRQLQPELLRLKQAAHNSGIPISHDEPWWSVLDEDRAARAAELDRKVSKILQPYENAGSMGVSGLGDKALGPGTGFLSASADGKPLLNAEPETQARAFEAARPVLDEIENDQKNLVRLQRGGQFNGEDVRGGAQDLFVDRDVQTPESLAEINATTQRIAANRAKLMEITDPLRKGAMHTADEFGEAVRASMEKNISAKTKAMMDLAEQDPEMANHLAETYARLAESTSAYRDAVGGTIGMRVTPTGKDAVEIAKRMMGTSDEMAAMSTIGQMASAAGGVSNQQPNTFYRFLNAVDRRYRPLFGARNGEAAAVMSHVRAELRGWALAGAHLGNEYYKGIIDAARAAGLTDPRMLDDAGTLAGMFLHQISGNESVFPKMVPELDKAGRETGNLVQSKLMERMGGADGKGGMLGELRTKLGPQQSEKFFDSLRAVAQRAHEELGSVGDENLKDYLLNYMLPHGYIPHTLAADSAQMLRSLKKLPEWRKGGGFAGTPKESFQRPRLSDLYMFKDNRPEMAGKYESFLEGDRWLQDVGEQGMEAIRRENGEDAYNRAVELRERMDRYDRLPDKPAPTPLDLYTLNDYIRRGRFAQFAQGKTTPFFEERLPVFMANRLAANERAKATQDMMSLAGMYALPMKKGQLADLVAKLHMSNGAPQQIVLPSGETATVAMVTPARGGTQVPVLYARGQSWRALSPDLAKWDDNPVIKLFAESLQHSVLPEPVADFIEDVAHVWRDDNVVPMLSAITRATSIYKSMTLLHPSWFINDFIGDMTLLAQAGINPLSLVKHLPTAIRIRRFRDDPETLAGLKTILNGQDVTGTALATHAVQGHVFGQHNAGEIMSEMMVGANQSRPSRLASLGAVDGAKQDFNWRVQRTLGNTPDPGILRKVGANALGGLDVAQESIRRKVFLPWAKANEFMHDTIRLAAHMSLLDEGHDVAGSLDKIRRSMYDFQDFTNFEQQYMRKLVPFYAWTKSNLSYQVRQFFQNPRFIAAFPKLHVALEDALAGDQKVPENMRPSWMRSSLATQVGTDPDSRMALMLGSSIPPLEALEIMQGATGAQGAMDAGKHLLSQVNPVLSVPAELAAGRDLYSGKDISGVPGSGDVTAGEFLTSSIRPYAEYGPGGRVQKAFERGGVTQGLTRAIAGGRAQAFDQERLTSTRARELRDQAEGLRRSITMSERNGDKTTSLRSRAKLLQTYQEAMRLGLEKDVQVPKWARDTLAQFNAAG